MISKGDCYSESVNYMTLQFVDAIAKLDVAKHAIGKFQLSVEQYKVDVNLAMIKAGVFGSLVLAEIPMEKHKAIFDAVIAALINEAKDQSP